MKTNRMKAKLQRLVLLLIVMVCGYSVAKADAVECSYYTNVTTEAVSSYEKTITTSSGTYTFTVQKAYNITVVQPANTNYDHAIVRIPYAQMAEDIDFDVNEWLNKTTAISGQFWFPKDAAGTTYGNNNDNWYAGTDGTAGYRSAYDNSDARFFIQQQRSDELASGNFIFWFGQHGASGKTTTAGTTYTITYYLVNGSKGIEFNLTLRVVALTYPTTLIIADDLKIVGTKDITINDYPRSDNYAGHLVSNIESPDITELLGLTTTNFTADMIYGQSSATEICNTKTASETAGATNYGFWFNNSSDNYYADAYSSSDSRMYISRLRYYSTPSLEVMWGQGPGKCGTSHSYTATCYFVNGYQVDGKYLAYQVNVTFNFKPLAISEDEDFVVEGSGITQATLKRTLKAGMHNTVVLPFALSLAKAKSVFGEGTTMYQVDKYNNGYITIVEQETSEAHVPFMLVPETVNADNTYSFTDISASAQGSATLTKEFTNGQMVGSYNASTTISKSEITDTENYVISSDKFYHIGDVSATMQGTRAYLQLSTGESGVKSVITFGDVETNMDAVSTDRVGLSAIYTLAGQRVMNPIHGLYIMNGKKYLIK